MNKKRVALITNGVFPVPAVKGGAVETLVEQLIKENEVQNRLDFELFSIFDLDAFEQAQQYKNSKFQFINTPTIIILLDKMVYFIAFNILHLKNHLSFSHIFKSFYYIYQVAILLDKNNYDILVFENQLATLWALKYKKNLKKYRGKIYFHLHNRPARYAGTQSLLKEIKIIGVSQFINELFKKECGLDLEDEQFLILKNNIDINRFNYKIDSSVFEEEIKQKYSIKDEKIILFVGRIMEGKGIRHLLEAIENINEIKLIVVGSYNFATSSNQDFFQKEIASLVERNKEKVIFTGFVPNDKVAYYYSIADLVVLPSICDEAAGLTMLEAVAMRKPLITTNAGGISEYISSEAAVILDRYSDLTVEINKAIVDFLFNKKQIVKQNYSKHNGYEGILGLNKYFEEFCNIIN